MTSNGDVPYTSLKETLPQPRAESEKIAAFFIMHNLLSKLFAKKGIKDVNELDQEERAVFGEYERVLNKKELTIEEVKKFIETQITIIENKWKELDTDLEKKAQLIPYHTAYKAILAAISAPESERANLELYLTQLLK